MIVERIRKKYLAVREDLDERGRRRWAAAEARDLGWGGVTAVCLATGMSDRTVRTGIQEFESPEVLDSSRQRKPGGGRRSLESTTPGLVRALEQIVDSAARGDPISPLRWSSKSTRTIAQQRERLGFAASHSTVATLLRSLGFITRNWQEVPLETYEIVVNLIGGTKTDEGLEVQAWLDERQYKKKRPITNAQLCDVRIKRDNFHGEWNYTIVPDHT